MIREEDRRQLLVYYVSQAFQGAEAKYPHIEKIVFVLIVASRKLCPHFQENPILAMIDLPIKKVMIKPEAARRMIQWAVELSQFDFEYYPRTYIKAQALAYFITEFTIPDEEGTTGKVERWIIQTDGSSVQKRGGLGDIIITLKREMLKYEVQLSFLATNNEVEYEGILIGLKVEKVKNFLLQSDSKLVVGQIKGNSKQRRKGCKNT